MSLPPIVDRELRVQSRSRATYWLRLLAGASAAIALGVALVMEDELAIFGRRSRGPWLFALIHTAISIVLAVACPLMCADTLARERREGTLGLLLLTPLKPRSIVWGKMTVHLLRAFTIWLSVAPILSVPFLMGGLGPADIGFALGLELGVVLGGLAAGLLASSLAERWGAATGLAALFAVLIGQGLALLSFLSFLPFFLTNERMRGVEILVLLATLMPWVVGSGLVENGFSSMLARTPAWMGRGILTAFCVVVPGSVLVFIAACRLTAIRVRRFSQMPEGTTRWEGRRRFWLKPLAELGHRRRRNRILRRYPLLWLYTLQPMSRLNRWGWCGLVILVWCGIAWAGIQDADTGPWVFGIPTVLVAALALAASASFRGEIEEGAFELLLVTPLRPFAILQARIYALWTDFLPALTLATLLALHWMLFHNYRKEDLLTLVALWTSFVAVPFVGSRLAVRRLNPLVGWLWTLGLTVALPGVFGFMAVLVTESDPDEQWSVVVRFLCAATLLQAVEAAVCLWATVHDLAARQFQLMPPRRVTT